MIGSSVSGGNQTLARSMGLAQFVERGLGVHVDVELGHYDSRVLA